MKIFRVWLRALRSWLLADLAVLVSENGRAAEARIGELSAQVSELRAVVVGSEVRVCREVVGVAAAVAGAARDELTSGSLTEVEAVSWAAAKVGADAQFCQQATEAERLAEVVLWSGHFLRDAAKWPPVHLGRLERLARRRLGLG